MYGCESHDNAISLQSAILEKITKPNMNDEQIHSQYMTMWEPAVIEMEKVDAHIKAGARYVVLPVLNVQKFHWFTVTIDIEARDFIVSNSMSFATHKAPQNRMVSALL